MGHGEPAKEGPAGGRPEGGGPAKGGSLEEGGHGEPAKEGPAGGRPEGGGPARGGGPAGGAVHYPLLHRPCEAMSLVWTAHGVHRRFQRLRLARAHTREKM